MAGEQELSSFLFHFRNLVCCLPKALRLSKLLDRFERTHDKLWDSFFFPGGNSFLGWRTHRGGVRLCCITNQTKNLVAKLSTTYNFSLIWGWAGWFSSFFLGVDLLQKPHPHIWASPERPVMSWATLILKEASQLFSVVGVQGSQRGKCFPASLCIVFASVLLAKADHTVKLRLKGTSPF